MSIQDDHVHARGASLESSRMCKVCGAETDFFGVVDFNRVCSSKRYEDQLSGLPIYFRKCRTCAFLFTNAMDDFSSEDWVNRVYNEYYYAVLDTDYAEARPKLNAKMLSVVVNVAQRDFGRITGLDYGGGNGALAAELKKAGFDFFSHDPFAFSDASGSLLGRCTIVSAFEVLEHTVDPLRTVMDMLRWTSEKFLLVIGTQCHDGNADELGDLSWPYIAPRNGHVSIYSRESMQIIARKFGLDYCLISRGTHLFGRGIKLRPYRNRLLAHKIWARLSS